MDRLKSAFNKVTGTPARMAALAIIAVAAVFVLKETGQIAPIIGVYAIAMTAVAGMYGIAKRFQEQKKSPRTYRPTV